MNIGNPQGLTKEFNELVVGDVFYYEDDTLFMRIQEVKDVSGHNKNVVTLTGTPGKLWKFSDCGREICELVNIEFGEQK